MKRFEPGLVSVFLPVYNGARYLRESIDSVLAQNYSNFELLIWDDGSKDGTSLIVDSYKDPRIRRYRNSKNTGLFPTLNLAFEEAKGELLRLWAYDDRMKTCCLKTEVGFWRAHPKIGMSYCACDDIDEDGNALTMEWDRPAQEIITPAMAAQLMFYHGSIPGNISTVMLHRTVIDEVGPFANMRQAADYEMWVRISERYPIGFIRQPLVELRSHPEQFGRWFSDGLVSMRESHVIFRTLFERLPLELKPYARRYIRRTRLVYNVHYMLRALQKGHFKIARDAFREIGRMDNFLRVLLLWLVTVNGRFFKPKPIFRT